MLEPLSKRYLVRWDNLPNDRFIIFVYDKFIGRIIYKVNTKIKKPEYDWIREYYGEENCDKPPLEPTPVKRYE